MDPLMQPNFADDLQNPHALGQQAAQGAGVKPVATPPAPKLQIPAGPDYMYAKTGMPLQQLQPAAPVSPPSEEPTFADIDTPPGVAAPEAAAAVADANVPLNPANIDIIKAAQQAIVAQKVGAVKQALGGADFNPATGDSNTWRRARMGIMANAADRAKYLQDTLPPGSDVKVINAQGVGPMVVFKLPGATAYQPVKGTEDVAGPIGDVASAIPSVGTQVGTAVATGGESLLYRLFAQALTSAGERGAELLTNKAGGYDTQPLSADAADMAKSGAIASGAELGASALSNLAGKGGGAFNAPSVGKERMAATKTLQEFDPELKPLTSFQMGHPLLEAKGARLAAVNPFLGDKAAQQSSTLAQLIARSVAGATGGGPPAIGDSAVQVGNVLYPGLAQLVEKMQAEAAAPLAAIPAVSPTAGGQAFQQGARNVKDKLASRTAQKFEDAFAAARNAPEAPNGVVPFDLTNTHAAIDQLSKPIYAQVPPETITKEVPVMGSGGLGEPVQIGTRTETSVEPRDTQLGGLSSKIADIVEKLRSFNPSMGVGPMTKRTDAPYDALKAVRSQLSEASVYNPMEPGASRQASGQAQRILRPLDEALVKPGEGAPADFVPKMQSAQNASKFQGKVLDNPDMQTAMHTPYPEDIMKLADPANATFLKTAQRVMDPENFAKFQDAYATMVIREPEKIGNLVAAFRQDPAVLDRLISPSRKGAIVNYAAAMKNIEESLPNKLLGINDFGARARTAFENTTGKALADFVEKSGGREGPIGQNLRGALFQNVLDNSMSTEGKLDMGRAVKAVSDVLKDGRAAAVLTPDELARLEAIRTYAAGGDTLSKGLGSSIYASEISGKLGIPQAILQPRQFLRALGELAEANIQAHGWGSKAGTRFLFGQPGGSPPTLPRAIGTGGAAYEVNQKRQEPTVGQ